MFLLMHLSHWKWNRQPIMPERMDRFRKLSALELTYIQVNKRRYHIKQSEDKGHQPPHKLFTLLILSFLFHLFISFCKAPVMYQILVSKYSFPTSDLIGGLWGILIEGNFRHAVIRLSQSHLNVNATGCQGLALGIYTCQTYWEYVKQHWWWLF